MLSNLLNLYAQYGEFELYLDNKYVGLFSNNYKNYKLELDYKKYLNCKVDNFYASKQGLIIYLKK